MCRKGGTDQPFPYRRVAKIENIVSPRMNVGMNEALTSQGESARLPKLLGASEGLYSSTVGSISTTLLLYLGAPAVVGACLAVWTR